ncbi:serine/arginine repetitive matrix protein 1-like [Elephas maximus indicus]|uniref:serine/arginine repetitive matrix protein 1-like n=1 Tax=Elephas maximus indicus TaxID=99487 RepID=UPI002116D088|nr:serine/arginine repetitive matrix protein 1-like [Elephas maximus indicus]
MATGVARPAPPGPPRCPRALGLLGPSQLRGPCWPGLVQPKMVVLRESGLEDPCHPHMANLVLPPLRQPQAPHDYHKDAGLLGYYLGLHHPLGCDLGRRPQAPIPEKCCLLAAPSACTRLSPHPAHGGSKQCPPCSHRAEPPLLPPSRAPKRRTRPRPALQPAPGVDLRRTESPNKGNRSLGKRAPQEAGAAAASGLLFRSPSAPPRWPLAQQRLRMSPPHSATLSPLLHSPTSLRARSPRLPGLLPPRPGRRYRLRTPQRAPRAPTHHAPHSRPGSLPRPGRRHKDTLRPRRRADAPTFPPDTGPIRRATRRTRIPSHKLDPQFSSPHAADPPQPAAQTSHKPPHPGHTGRLRSAAPQTAIR